MARSHGPRFIVAVSTRSLGPVLISGQRVVLVSQNNFAADGPRPQVLVACEDLNMALRAMNVLALIAREAGGHHQYSILDVAIRFLQVADLERSRRSSSATGGHHRCRTREQRRRPGRSGHIVAGTMGRPPPTPSRRADRRIRPRDRTASRHERRGPPIASGSRVDRHGFFVQRASTIRCRFRWQSGNARRNRIDTLSR
jgi:hypothetical protein